MRSDMSPQETIIYFYKTIQQQNLRLLKMPQELILALNSHGHSLLKETLFLLNHSVGVPRSLDSLILNLLNLNKNEKTSEDYLIFTLKAFEVHIVQVYKRQGHFIPNSYLEQILDILKQTKSFGVKYWICSIVDQCGIQKTMFLNEIEKIKKSLRFSIVMEKQRKEKQLLREILK